MARLVQASATRAADARPAATSSRRWPLVDSTALAVAVAMGLIGLIAGFGVYYLKGGIRTKPPPEPEPPPSVAATPATAARWAWLLAGRCDHRVLTSTRPGPGLRGAHEAGPARSLDRRRPAASRLRYGRAARALAAQIDHIAGGSQRRGVAASRSSWCCAARWTTRRSSSSGSRRGRPNGPKQSLSGGHFRSVQSDLTLARVSPTIWVFGLDAKKDFEAVDKGGYGPGGKQFASTLTEAIAGARSARGGRLAGDRRGALGRQASGPVLARPVRREDRVVEGAREGPGGGRGASRSMNRRVCASFSRSPTSEPRGRSGPISRSGPRRNEQVRHGGAGELAFLDVPIDPVKTFAVLRQLLSDAAKP